MGPPMVHEMACSTPMAPPPPRAFGGDASIPPALALLTLGLGDMALDAYVALKGCAPWEAELAGAPKPTAASALADEASTADVAASDGLLSGIVGSHCEELYESLNELLLALDPSHWTALSDQRSGSSHETSSIIHSGDLSSATSSGVLSSHPPMSPSLNAPSTPSRDRLSQPLGRLSRRMSSHSSGSIQAKTTVLPGGLPAGKLGSVTGGARNADVDDDGASTPGSFVETPSLFRSSTAASSVLSESQSSIFGSETFTVPGLENFDLSDGSMLGVEWQELHAGVLAALLAYDEQYISPLAAGTVPAAAELAELLTSALALCQLARRCLKRLEKGSAVRLPVFSLLLWASRVATEVSQFQAAMAGQGQAQDTKSGVPGEGLPKSKATAVGDKDDDENDDEWDDEKVPGGTKSAATADELLKELVREVQGVWHVSDGTLYSLGVTNVGLLARYTALGRALRALRDAKSAREAYGQLDQQQVWEDGMDELRKVLDEKRSKPEAERALGTRMKMGLISDYLWYAKWTGVEEGALAVDKIPAEVPVSMLLADLGAPRSLEPLLTEENRPQLQRFVLGDYREEIEGILVGKMLSWAEGVPGGEFAIYRGRKGGAVAKQGGSVETADGRRVKNARPGAPQAELEEISKKAGISRMVKLEEILLATNSWCPSAKVGEGAFGGVYRGLASNGEQWAVKRANTVSEDSIEEFENEVEALGKMRHQHLVRLVGYYADPSECILVYEFAARGSLASVLRPKGGLGLGKKAEALSFEQRLDIAVGAAEGIRYLHCFSNPAIIHRDIKSDNILLDDKLQAKVADFGRLKLLCGAGRHTRVVGTPGYCDPEYSRTYLATDKSDIYSFGVVLLELLTGRRAIVEESKRKLPGFFRRLHGKKAGPVYKEPTTLVSWAIPLISAGKIKALMDPALEGNYNVPAAKALASIAAMCVQKNSTDRPGISEVATRLAAIQHGVRDLQACAVTDAARSLFRFRDSLKGSKKEGKEDGKKGSGAAGKDKDGQKESKAKDKDGKQKELELRKVKGKVTERLDSFVFSIPK